MTTGWQLGRRPSLDGLRGVAILLVLVCHITQQTGMTNALGANGVTLFFTLSGFLITSLLVEERADRGGVDLLRFYKRRARRLLPALLVMLAVMSVFLAAAGLASPAEAIPPVLYVSNWVAATGHAPWLPYFGHTWSLSVEEQFYLVWPMAVLVSSRRRLGLGLVCAVGIVVANVERLLMWDGGFGYARVYFGTDTHADALLLGCLAAVIVHEFGLPRVPLVVTVGAVGLVVLTGISTGKGGWLLLVLMVVPWLAAVAIVGACNGTRLLSGPTIRWFGRRSYAIYLWHFPLLILSQAVRPGPICALVAVLVSMGLAELSWRLVESWWLEPRVAVSGSHPAELPAVRLTQA